MHIFNKTKMLQYATRTRKYVLPQIYTLQAYKQNLKICNSTGIYNENKTLQSTKKGNQKPYLHRNIQPEQRKNMAEHAINIHHHTQESNQKQHLRENIQPKKEHIPERTIGIDHHSLITRCKHTINIHPHGQNTECKRCRESIYSPIS